WWSSGRGWWSAGPTLRLPGDPLRAGVEEPVGRLRPPAPPVVDLHRRSGVEQGLDDPPCLHDTVLPGKQRLVTAEGVSDQPGVCADPGGDGKSTRLNSSPGTTSYAVFCL